MRVRYTPLLAALLLLVGPAQSWAQAVAQALPSAPAVIVPVAQIRLVAPAASAASLRTGALVGSAPLPLPSRLPTPRAAVAARPGILPSALPNAARPGLRVLSGGKASAAAPVAAPSQTQAAPSVREGIADLARGLAAENGAAEASPSRLLRIASFYDGKKTPAAAADPVPVESPRTLQDAALLGPAETSSSTADPVPASPTPTDPATERKARQALIATGVFKVGMEALNIAMPLIALTVLGSATWMATMAVAWGAAMTASSMLSGGLLDRKPVQKVLAGAMAVESVSVLAVAGLLLSGLANPALLLSLHAVSGAMMGVIVTARNCLPGRLLGRDRAALSAFNSKTHIVYEVSGTVAPLLVGLLIKIGGLVPALFILPPAYLLAGILFWRLPLDAPAAAAPVPASLGALARQAVADVKEGSRILRSSEKLRWISVLILGPMIVHRIFEQMMVPFFTKTVLGAAEKSAWIVSASNFGELVGAGLLLRALMASAAEKKPYSPYRWARWMALGTLAVWGLSATSSILPLLPLVVLMSVTWAANDIGLTSALQAKLSEQTEGKAMGFLMAAELALILASSYLLGFVFDLMPGPAAFWLINGILTVLAGIFWVGARRLAALHLRGDPPSQPS